MVLNMYIMATPKNLIEYLIRERKYFIGDSRVYSYSNKSVTVVSMYNPSRIMNFRKYDTNNKWFTN